MTGNVNYGVQTGDGAGLGPQGSRLLGGVASDPEAEQALMTRIAAGDHTESVETLYDIYARQIYALGRRYLGDSGLAEDLVQETFIRLWRSAAKYDSAKGSVRTFVFTIARRVAIDVKRRAEVRPVLAAASTGAPSLEHADPAADLGFDRALLVREMREAVATLPAAQAEVIRLAYLGDLSQPQIAEQLGVPLGTVKSRTYHGMRALRERLQEVV